MQEEKALVTKKQTHFSIQGAQKRAPALLQVSLLILSLSSLQGCRLKEAEADLRLKEESLGKRLCVNNISPYSQNLNAPGLFHKTLKGFRLRKQDQLNICAQRNAEFDLDPAAKNSTRFDVEYWIERRPRSRTAGVIYAQTGCGHRLGVICVSDSFKIKADPIILTPQQAAQEKNQPKVEPFREKMAVLYGESNNIKAVMRWTRPVGKLTSKRGLLGQIEGETTRQVGPEASRPLLAQMFLPETQIRELRNNLNVRRRYAYAMELTLEEKIWSKFTESSQRRGYKLDIAPQNFDMNLIQDVYVTKLNNESTEVTRYGNLFTFKREIRWSGSEASSIDNLTLEEYNQQVAEKGPYLEPVWTVFDSYYPLMTHWEFKFEDEKIADMRRVSALLPIALDWLKRYLTVERAYRQKQVPVDQNGNPLNPNHPALQETAPEPQVPKNQIIPTDGQLRQPKVEENNIIPVGEELKNRETQQPATEQRETVPAL